VGGSDAAALPNLSQADFDVPKRERLARVEEALTHFPEIAAKRPNWAGRQWPAEGACGGGSRL
jgi:hypothetical protein